MPILQEIYFRTLSVPQSQKVDVVSTVDYTTIGPWFVFGSSSASLGLRRLEILNLQSMEYILKGKVG